VQRMRPRSSAHALWTSSAPLGVTRWTQPVTRCTQPDSQPRPRSLCDLSTRPFASAALLWRLASLGARRDSHMGACDLLASARDRAKYADVADLRARVRDLAQTISSLDGDLARAEAAHTQYVRWEAEEQRLVEIRDDLKSRQARMDSLFKHIASKSGYLAHVYDGIILPRLAEAVHLFLDTVARFRVEVAGGDLEVHFTGEGYSMDLNHLGGADRFQLELAARCALRQMGTPGFNWPISFIDEGFVAFDSSRREMIGANLAAMVSVGGFAKIVLTSHLECVKDACMRTLTIERHEGKSWLVAADPPT
jgi:hypothetical protein